VTAARPTEDSTDWSDLSNLTLLDEIRIGIWSRGIGEHVVVPLGRPATVEDLHLTKLKAEIVDGQLIAIGPTVVASAEATWNIRESLHRYEKTAGGGHAYGSRLAFIVDLPHRKSFCPDVSWYIGDPKASYFPHGAPVFAVEVRDPPEYGRNVPSSSAGARWRTRSRRCRGGGSRWTTSSGRRPAEGNRPASDARRRVRRAGDGGGGAAGCLRRPIGSGTFAEHPDAPFQHASSALSHPRGPVSGRADAAAHL
jgi:hypothetical protein